MRARRASARPAGALPLRPVARAFFARPVLEVARDLLGCLLVHETPDGRLSARIVETEAYGEEDPGSHAFRGLTPRSAPMFEEPGHAYVYFIYGNHWCLNAVTDPAGRAGAVLLRAAEPLEGIELMRRARGARVSDRDLTRGPARLTQAFRITGAHNRADLTGPPLSVCAGERLPEDLLATGPRVGLGKGQQDGRPWRFWVRESPWISAGRMG